jgi:cell division protein ZapA (FtsZ GTPase activity inhibitor)
MALENLAYIVKQINGLRERGEVSGETDVLSVAIIDLAEELAKLDERLRAIEQVRPNSN